MKTLIIHPEDQSTTFLEIVYRDIPDKTVLTRGSAREVRELIESHDRVMMMGHGSPKGLFAVGKFWGNGPYIIDETTVSLLEKKDQNIYIWCNADRFVNEFGLKGFYTGMFISEVGEAWYCGLPYTTQDMVDESNYGFCEILMEHANESKDEIHEKVKQSYGLIAEENPVAYYNNNRLYKN